MKNVARYTLVLAGLLLFLVLIVRLDSVPPTWWDEGWTLSVARNWVESRHYGRLSLGQKVPAGLQAALPVTGSVALSFLFFGIGIVQARMVGIVITVATLLLLYYLARRTYNQSIALGALFVTTFLPGYIELFPIYMGRQVLGEIPAMFFLLAGYVAILAIPRGPLWALCLAILFWAIALATKAQVLPFWTCSLLGSCLLAMYRRDWKASLSWLIALVGSFAGSRVILMLSEQLQSKSGNAQPITGLYEVTAAVGSIPSRMFALIVVVLFGVPTLLGLCYGLRRLLKDNIQGTYTEQVRVALLFLASSWFGWFMFFSVGWIRYVFPATFIGSIFVAAMMYNFTRGYDVGYTIQQSRAFLTGRFNKEALGALVVAVIIVTSVPRTAGALYKAYVLEADTSVHQAAEFLNSQTRPDALIETYDSELFFLLNRPYHYPPDQIHVALIRRTFLYDDNAVIDYDPLAANPDYLVVGPHSRQWRLYDSVLKTGQFRLIRAYKRYNVYERIR
jgi:4-amino-4-deoxy-L-arabinose transferase-like glycosyltransferase